MQPIYAWIETPKDHDHSIEESESVDVRTQATEEDVYMDLPDSKQVTSLVFKNKNVPTSHSALVILLDYPSTSIVPDKQVPPSTISKPPSFDFINQD